MGSKSNPVLDALAKLEATRKARRSELEASGLIAANDEEPVVTNIPATTEEASRRMSKITRQKKVPADAIANDFRQRRILGDDF